MTSIVEKDRHRTGQLGVWGTFNNAANLTASPEGYLLAIGRQDAPRLDDLTPAEEQAFWGFMFSSGLNGIKDEAGRGPGRVSDNKDMECSVVCAINDGIAAWQSVGTVHGHVIWIPRADANFDMQQRLLTDRTCFAGTGKEHPPLASRIVPLGGPNDVSDIRAARNSLRNELNGPGIDKDAVGFSLYTQTPFHADPREGASIVIEAWTPEHHAVASLSQFVRSWQNLVPTPVSPHAMGIKYGSFAPRI